LAAAGKIKVRAKLGLACNKKAYHLGQSDTLFFPVFVGDSIELHLFIVERDFLHY